VSANVAFSAFKPGEIFNIGTGQTLPSDREVFLDPQQIDRRAGGGGTERLSRDLAAKAWCCR
jgi:hypothetical protein